MNFLLFKSLKMTLFHPALVSVVLRITAAGKTWDFVLSFFQFEKVVSGMQFVCVYASQPVSLSVCLSVHSSSVKTVTHTHTRVLNKPVFFPEKAYCYLN
jgi:hypothetical protein